MLIAAVVLLLIVMAAAAGISHLTLSSAMDSTQRVASERAFYAAESARLMDGDVKNLAPDLHGLKNPEGPNLPHKTDICSSGNLYIGWVGNDSDNWDNALARHAICGGSAATWPDDGQTPPGWVEAKAPFQWGQIPNDANIIIDDVNLPHGHLEDFTGKILFRQAFDLGGRFTTDACVCVRGDIFKINKHTRFNNAACYTGENTSNSSDAEVHATGMQPCNGGCPGLDGSGDSGGWSYAGPD